MADTALASMAAASDLDGSELFYVVQGGADRKATSAQINTSTNRKVQVDKGTVGTGTVTFDASLNEKGKLTVSGALAIAFSNWPAAGTYGEYEIELINAGTNVTFPTTNWLKGDGTNSTTFSTMGVTLYASGTNFVIFWTTNGGTTIYGTAS